MAWCTQLLRTSRIPRKLPEKWTFLSVAFYNAPSLRTVERLDNGHEFRGQLETVSALTVPRKSSGKRMLSLMVSWGRTENLGVVLPQLTLSNIKVNRSVIQRLFSSDLFCLWITLLMTKGRLEGREVPGEKNSGESKQPLTPILLKSIAIHLPFLWHTFAKVCPPLVTGTQSTTLFGDHPFSIKHPQDNFGLQNVNWHPPKCKSTPSKM